MYIYANPGITIKEFKTAVTEMYPDIILNDLYTERADV